MYGYTVFHDKIINTLISSVHNGTNSHAYIFEGPAGMYRHEAERIEIINEAEIIYSENQVIERLLAFCVADEFHKFTVQKDEAVRRYHDCGTAYIQ